jgi:hypothetical protein
LQLEKNCPKLPNPMGEPMGENFGHPACLRELPKENALAVGGKCTTRLIKRFESF